MYKNILLPLGLSELNPAVLDVAGALASAERAKVTLIHVVQTFEGEADDETEEFYNDLQQKAEGHLKRARELLLTKDIAAQQVILLGDKATEVIQYAQQQKIDLIIMESHQINKDRLAEGLGSFSRQVAVLSPCSVLLAR